jgi:hypothetical protein
VLAGTGLCVVVAVTALLIGPWSASDSSHGDAGPTPAPAGRVHPVLPDPDGDRYHAKLSAEWIARRDAFRQKAADVIERLLPPGAVVAISETAIGDYRLTMDGADYAISFRVEPVRRGGPPKPGVVYAVPDLAAAGRPAYPGIEPYVPGCRPGRPRTPGIACLDSSLPTGDVVVVYFPERSGGPIPPGGAHGPSASFQYRGALVNLLAYADTRSRTTAPITGDQWLRLVTDPSFLELVDYWRTHREMNG